MNVTASAVAWGDVDDTRLPGWIYRDLDVEPIIQCAGVRTNYGSSNPSDEVIAAMSAAAEAFVDMDELAEGVGRRLAQLTGAEWGVITAGTAATLALATAACIAGNNPELMLKLPRTDGLPNRVIIPADQRFAYEQAIRIAGAEIVSVSSMEDFVRALDGTIAMICLIGRADPVSKVPLRMILPLARSHGVPVLVNASGLSPQNPDPWVRNGADLVVYAGGKYLRAPQSTAVVLGSERLCRAMWWNGPPHQAFGRCMKVGKEEMIGAVVALNRWINFESAKHERAQWLPRLQRVNDRVASVAGVRTQILPSSGSVTATRLRISWDAELVGVDAEMLRLALLDQRPRILIHDFWSTPTSIVIDPINLSDAEADLVGDALAVAFIESKPSKLSTANAEPEIDVSGNWVAELRFLHGQATHHLELKQAGHIVRGGHKTAQMIGEIVGEVRGRHVAFEAAHEQVPIWLFYGFNADMDSEGVLHGTVRLGGTAREHLGPVFKAQFGEATWSARFHSA
jgi:D-glucosaminate-6-phosphate ammonia-lyase